MGEVLISWHIKYKSWFSQKLNCFGVTGLAEFDPWAVLYILQLQLQQCTILQLQLQYLTKTCVFVSTHSRQSQRLLQRNSAIRQYEEKPLQLFDAMRYSARDCHHYQWRILLNHDLIRYSNETIKRRGVFRRSETPRTPGESDGRRTASREKRLSSRYGWVGL